MNKIIVSVVIILVILGGVGSYFFIFNKKQSSAEEIKANLVLDIVTPKDTYKIGERFGENYSFGGVYGSAESFNKGINSCYTEIIQKKPLYGILEIDTISKDNYKRVLTWSLPSNFENKINTGDFSISSISAAIMTEDGYEISDFFTEKGMYIYSIEIYSCEDLEKEFNQKCEGTYSPFSYLPDNFNDLKSKPIISKSKIITVTD